MAQRVEQDQLSSSSMQRHLTSIRQFMKWAEQGKYLEINPTDDFKLKRQPRPLPGMIDIETVNQILDQPMPENQLISNCGYVIKPCLSYFTQVVYGSLNCKA